MTISRGHGRPIPPRIAKVTLTRRRCAEFRNWVLRENLLADDAVVVEWVGQNPLAHQDPRYAPVGDYMFTRLDDCVRQVS